MDGYYCCKYLASDVIIRLSAYNWHLNDFQFNGLRNDYQNDIE